MLHKKNWLIIANGEPIPTKQLLELAKNKCIMVLDGAFTTTLTHSIKPDIVLGDFDSIDENTKTLMHNQKSILFIHEPEQNTTDLEKGLQYLSQLNPDTVTIINATGWRLDHTLYNLRLLKRFHKKFKRLSLLTTTEKIFYIENQTITLHAAHAQPLALLAFTEATVRSTGLEYDMHDLTLQFGYQESTSNAVISKTAELTITGCALLLISHDTDIRF